MMREKKRYDYKIIVVRSTPRRDEVYGGQDDLTAAIGWEENGVTTVMFRKPASGAQVCLNLYICVCSMN